MSEKDIQAAMEAIRQSNERALESPESARRFLQKISAPASSQEDAE